jgi:hypothetical protein
MPICVDKYKVREFVASKGFASILNEIYGVYDNPENIDFNILPDKFVIKTTDGGGGENIFICKDKRSLDIPLLIRELKKWKNKKLYNAGREWAYTKIEKSRYIIERYLENDKILVRGGGGGGVIDDYKFYCFYGKACYLHIDILRFIDHRRNFYDKNGKYLDVICTYRNYEDNDINLVSLKDLIYTAEQLSNDFPFVRVDLYYVKNKIYFGELTFYPGSGYEGFIPDEFDFELGSCFDINQIRNE